MLDGDEIGGEAELPPLARECFIGFGNNPILAKDTLVKRGYQALARGYCFSDKYRFKWVQTAGEVNYMKFIEGKHIVNHISNSKIFTNKIPCMELLADLNRSLQSGHIKSRIYKTTDEFLTPTYRLDSVADFVNFLKSDNNSLWLAKSSTSNMGRGIEMIRDPAAYKDSLMTKKDKWGETAAKPEEIKQAMDSANSPAAQASENNEEAKTEETKTAQPAAQAPEKHTNLIRLVN